MKTALVPGSVPQPAGPYSPAVVSPASSLLFVSAQGPIDPASGEVVKGEFEDQVRRCLLNIEAALTAAGLKMADLVKVSVLISDFTLFDRMNSVYSELVPEPYPARSIAQSLLPGIEVSIDAIAAFPNTQDGR